MRSGLLAVRAADATTVGTITLDSYTRIGAHEHAERALIDGTDLNGYPIVAHGPAVTRAVLDGVLSADFPVQVRHGSSDPRRIVTALLDSGLSATEGGPVSYCLPYSRTPLRDSVAHWAQACRSLAAQRGHGVEPHLETFGGCMMGQLCPPSLLVALSVLEGMFFHQHGMRSVSLSYAQQTSFAQDVEAIGALHTLTRRWLSDIDTHVVLYAYMGVYPDSPGGARTLLAHAARLAETTGCARLIVKTAAEARRIPTIEENVAALEHAAAASMRAAWPATGPLTAAGGMDAADTEVLTEAAALVDTVLDLRSAHRGDLGAALCDAFERGLLDVPYCLHPDNRGDARGHVASDGRLVWSSTGRMPLPGAASATRATRTTSAALHASLTYVRRRYDAPAETSTAPAVRDTAAVAAPAATPTTDTTVDPTRSVLPALAPTDRRPPMPEQPFTPPSPRDHLTSPDTRAVLTVASTALAAAREHLADNGFVELLPPIIGPVTDPGARGSKQVDIDYYGHRYKLMTSAILYKQAALLGFDKIYLIAPNVRLEPLETCSTNRHLAEFHQLDVELRGSREDAMRVLEELVRHVVRRVIAERAQELEDLGRDVDAFRELLDSPFHRVTHDTATADLHRVGHPQNPDGEIDWAGEAILSTKSTRPFFITDYPKGSRGFYDRESTTCPGVLRNFDLIAPEGYGELVSGSEREHEYARVIARIRETGENPAKYGWYLAMLRDGVPASAGFGVGIQRLVRYLTGLDSVWQATAFPKIPGVVSA